MKPAPKIDARVGRGTDKKRVAAGLLLIVPCAQVPVSMAPTVASPACASLPEAPMPGAVQNLVRLRRRMRDRYGDTAELVQQLDCDIAAREVLDAMLLAPTGDAGDRHRRLARSACRWSRQQQLTRGPWQFNPGSIQSPRIAHDSRRLSPAGCVVHRVCRRLQIRSRH